MFQKEQSRSSLSFKSVFKHTLIHTHTLVGDNFMRSGFSAKRLVCVKSRQNNITVCQLHIF